MAGEETLSDGSDTRHIETTMSHMGEDLSKLHEKTDHLVEGLNNFKVEVTRGFGEMNGAVDRVDQKIESHSSETDRRFDEHAEDIGEAKTAAAAASVAASTGRAEPPSKVQAAGWLGGAGAAGGLLTTFLNWVSSQVGGGGPTPH